MQHDEIKARELEAMPKHERRFHVRIELDADDKRLTLNRTDETDYDTEPGEMLGVAVTVDPSEFLDYITLAELLEHDEEHGFIKYGTHAERADLIARLDAVDSYEVDELLSEIGDALDQGRTADALLLIDRYQNPKFSSLAECKARYDAAMKA